MSAQEQKPATGGEDDVWGAITAFEQILEAMPNDTASLSVLAHAYAQIGDHARAVEYLLRLGQVFLDEQDGEAAQGMLDKLKPHESDSRVQHLIGRIESLASAAPPVPVSAELAAPEADPVAAPAGASDIEVKNLSQFKISEELSMAWNLMESGELTQDEYASVVQDLSDMSTAENDSATVSVLHVLESRGFKTLDRIVGTLARDCATPFVTLSAFEFRFEVMRLLPAEFCGRRGALVFEALGKDLLVAVLNPYDTQIRLDVEHLMRRRCHFFLALASDFDRVMSRYREAVQSAAVAEAAATASG